MRIFVSSFLLLTLSVVACDSGGGNHTTKANAQLRPWDYASAPEVEEADKPLYEKSIAALKTAVPSCSEVVSGGRSADFKYDKQYLIRCADGTEYAFTAASVKAGKVPAKPVLSPWTYSSDRDEMSDGNAAFARVSSTNSLEFDFPYDEPQTATLFIRKHPRYGTDVIIQIERGQILCRSYDECTVLVKFGDGKAQKFSALGPGDNSSESFFIQNVPRFIAAMSSAEKVAVEFPVYRQGNVQVFFNTSGFSMARLNDLAAGK